jgi:nicotinamidase/pyrazinamidase
MVANGTVGLRHRRTILTGVQALLIIDVQNDFCRGGALAVPDGDAVIEPINRLARELPFVVATRDWHPPNHGSFIANGGPWPEHCVADTPGAQIHERIDSGQIDAVIDAGRTPDAEGYSSFEDTALERLLRERGVDTVNIAGLALDYCVKATALDAKRAGFDVAVHRGATRAIEAQPGDAERAVQELLDAGVQVVD